MAGWGGGRLGESDALSAYDNVVHSAQRETINLAPRPPDPGALFLERGFRVWARSSAVRFCAHWNCFPCLLARVATSRWGSGFLQVKRCNTQLGERARGSSSSHAGNSGFRGEANLNRYLLWSTSSPRVPQLLRRRRWDFIEHRSAVSALPEVGSSLIQP